MNAPLLQPHATQLLAERIPLEGTGAVDVDRQRAVVAALKAFLPEHCVLWREEDTRPYECDGLTMYRQLPMIVALPETEEQVAGIARACGLKVVAFEEARNVIHQGAGPHFVVVKVEAEKIPLVLPPREGALLKARFRRAVLGPNADLD